jgi:hypothetical protein
MREVICKILEVNDVDSGAQRVGPRGRASAEHAESASQPP